MVSASRQRGPWDNDRFIAPALGVGAALTAAPTASRKLAPPTWTPPSLPYLDVDVPTSANNDDMVPRELAVSSADIARASSAERGMPSNAVRQAGAAVVRVEGMRAAPSQVPGIGDTVTELGSGWVAGEDLVVTNRHVAAVGVDAHISAAGFSGRAQVIARSETADLAILHAPGLGIAPLPLRDVSEDIGTLFQLGYPQQRVPDAVIDAGQVGGRRPLHAIGSTYVPSATPVRDPAPRPAIVVVTDHLPHLGGLSGGALLDESGAVVGTVFGGRGNVGAAVPNSELRPLLAKASEGVARWRASLPAPIPPPHHPVREALGGLSRNGRASMAVRAAGAGALLVGAGLLADAE